MNTTPAPDSVPLVRLLRAGHVESRHRGRYVLLEGDAVLARGGDTARRVFVRSAAKPVQALIGITSGAADRFNLDNRSLAVAAGSHSAAAVHLDAVRRTLTQSGVDIGALQCGGHWSIHAETARTQTLPAGVMKPPPLWSNCSGKHALMLAASRALGAPLDSYLSPQHPTQVAILEAVLALSGLSRNEVGIAIDGCGAPAPYLPLEAMARALQRFGHPEGLPSGLDDAARRVAQAMREHPGLVAGPDRFDTDLMEAGGGRILVKCGAEGVLMVLVPDRQLSLIVAVEDGADRGYRLFVIDLLLHLDVLDEAAAEVLSLRHAPRVVKNYAGTDIGSAESFIPAL